MLNLALVRSAWIMALLLFTVSGCRGPKPLEPDIVAQDDAGQELVLPDATLTGALLAQILTAEAAARRGQYELAVDEILAAAKLTSDPRLAAKGAWWSLGGGLYPRAIRASELWVELLADQPGKNREFARLILAGSLVETGQRDRALAEYRRLVQDSDDANIYKRVSAQMAKINRSDGLLALYQELIADSEDQSDAFVGLALLANNLEDAELAGRAVDQALLLDPDDEDAALIRFSFMVDEQDPEAVSSFSGQFLERNPDAVRLRREYAHYLSRHGNPRDAIRQFEKLARDDPQSWREATLGIISLATQEEDFDLADGKLEDMIERMPMDYQLIYFRCQVQREMENYETAAALCAEIVHGEYYFPAQLELAQILADSGKVRDAITKLEEIPVSGEDEQIQVYLAQQQVLYQARQLEQAVTLLNDALDRYPDNVSLLYARGLIFSELGWIEPHERDMRKLIRLEPRNAHAYNALGYTLADMTTRYDEALVLISTAVQLKPDDAYILDSLGWVYFKLNEYDKARVHLEQAYELSGDAEIAAHLGELYWVIGEKERARSLWRKAKKETPDNRVLNETLDRIL